jgi:integrase
MNTIRSQRLHVAGSKNHRNGAAMRDKGGNNSKEISQHLGYLRLEGKSELTIRDRRLLLERLAAALPVPLLHATHDDILTWRAGLTVAPGTVVNYVSNAAQFYKWARDIARLIDISPAEAIPVPRVGQRLPRPIAEAALMDVLAAAPRRIRPWIVLAGWAGLRCQEIAWLRGENVHLDASPPHVLVTRETAKGLRERIVQLSDFAAAELAAARLPRRGWCFTRRDGQAGPNKPARVSELICDLLHACGYADTGHALRHRLLTRVQQAGRDLRVTQQVAGHSDPATTTVYTLVSDTAALAALQAVPVPAPLRRAG